MPRKLEAKSDEEGAEGDPDKKSTKAVTRKECDQALDHGVELLVPKKKEREQLPAEVVTGLRQQLFLEGKRPAANPCVKGISREVYDCLMTATTSKDFQKCNKPAADTKDRPAAVKRK